MGRRWRARPSGLGSRGPDPHGPRIPGTSGLPVEHHGWVLPRGGIRGHRVLSACLAWVAVSTVATVVVERRNGAATANLQTSADVLFMLFALAPTVAGALTLVLTRNRLVGWLLVASTTLGMTALLLHAVVVAEARSGPASGFLVWPALWLGGPASRSLPSCPGGCGARLGGRCSNLSRSPPSALWPSSKPSARTRSPAWAPRSTRSRTPSTSRPSRTQHAS
jgi:hypothetical protein